MGATNDEARIGAALGRNDRYVREFVEALGLCPYARRCREGGRLHRRVLLAEGGSPGSPGFAVAVAVLDEAFAAFECLPVETVEVALLILPALAEPLSSGQAGAQAFEQLVGAARDRMQARHPNGDTPFYCVAFHPGFPEDLRDAHRAVRFIRRSPDPTVQLVRASVLREVRGANPGGKGYLDVAGMSAAELLAAGALLSVGDRIAEANLRTLHEQGANRLRALLEEFAVQGRAPEG